MNDNVSIPTSADEPPVSGTRANFHQFLEPVMAPALTARELISIAHVLIDAQDIDDNPDDEQLLVRAGIKTGIAAMCMAATSALNACGANAGAQVSDTVPTIPAKAGMSASQSWGLAGAPAVPAPPGMATPDSGLTAEKMAKLVSRQRRACDLLETMGGPQHVEAAGDLRCATGDLWDAVREQVAINMMPHALDDWMTTPAGLARVLVGALRKERIEEIGEYNDAVEDCIVAVVGTISAGAGAYNDDAVIPESGPDFSDRPDLHQLRDSMRADLAEPAPKVPVEDVVEILYQLRTVAGVAIDSDTVLACNRAMRIIEGLLPHAGAGVSV